MCIIVVAFDASERYPLMLAANRDERHARPATAAGWWEDLPGVLAGRDLVAGGTWLGASRTGRVAAVTNILEPGRAPAPASRGQLVSGFLAGADTPAAYAARIERDADRFGAFNLLLYRAGGAAPAAAAAHDAGRTASSALFYVSNRSAGGPLAPGLHAFGNNAPGEDWPKLERARAGMADLLSHDSPEDGMLALLAERAPTPGVSPRDSIFVLGDEFGTRCSSVVLIDTELHVRFVERRFARDGRSLGTSRFEFRLERG